jgi:hypothetical protein
VGVYGISTSGYGIYGTSTSNYGVYGTSAGGPGIYGTTTAANGVAVVASGGGTALEATTSATNGTGVDGEDNSSGGVGVYGSGASYGVYGSSNGTAVAGISTSGEGVYATSSTNNAIEAYNSGNGGSAVYGHCGTSGGYAIAGRNAVANNTGVAIYGEDYSSSGYAGLFQGRTNTTGCIQYNGTNEFGCTSDRRLKKNIAPLTSALDALLRLKGVTYEWKKPEEQGKNAIGRQTGFIAQEVEAVFPNWVDENADGFKTLAIQPAHVTALEVEAIRTLKMENDDLKDRVKALEAGRRPLVSGLGEGGIGFGLCALAGAIVVATRRRRS